MEVKYIWGERFRMTTLLYIWCRYGLVANIIYLLTISDMLDISCDAGYKISSALSVLGRTAVILIWGARTYAVLGRSRVVLVFLTTVGLSCIILDIMHIPLLLCTENSSNPLIGRVLSIMMCIFEICSAALATIRCVKALSVGGPWYTQKKSFVFLLFEQGAVYFCFVTVLTVASLALNFRVPGGFLQRLLNALTLPISGMMTARFILHLRKFEAKHTAFTTTNGENSGETSDIEFARNHNQTATQSRIDDFVEDPVRRV